MCSIVYHMHASYVFATRHGRGHTLSWCACVRVRVCEGSLRQARALPTVACPVWGARCAAPCVPGTPWVASLARGPVARCIRAAVRRSFCGFFCGGSWRPCAAPSARRAAHLHWPGLFGRALVFCVAAQCHPRVPLRCLFYALGVLDGPWARRALHSCCRASVPLRPFFP
jgi:hypothetical protein